MEIVHTPVLLNECLEYLSPVGETFENDAYMIDSTLGEGGHSNAFLSKFPNLHIIGLDADKNIQARAKERLSKFADEGRMRFFNGWFNDFYANFDEQTELTQGKHPNLILFDLGISVYHYERSGRGFSFRYDEPLDMRLNFEEGESAADIVNSWKEEELANMIYLYSDEKMSRRIAKAICDARSLSKIESSKALAEIIYNSVPGSYKHGNIHPATRTFQALRIAVNSELRRLPQAIHLAFNILEVGGKLGVITFHSLEDRIVKNYFRNLGKQCVCPPEQAICSCGGTACASILTKKPIDPTAQEVKENSPSRSAKLRVVRKIRNATEKHLLHVDAM